MEKREIFRECFAGFDYEIVACFTEDDVARILATPGMIRSPQKVRAIINNARAFKQIRKGCTIGTTMTITDKAVPNVVGVDIGCGMYTVKLNTQDIDFEKMDAAAHFIPSGRNVWDGRKEKFDLTGLKCYRHLKDTKRLERSLGTLGGGNHTKPLFFAFVLRS